MKIEQETQQSIAAEVLIAMRCLSRDPDDADQRSYTVALLRSLADSIAYGVGAPDVQQAIAESGVNDW